MEYVAYELEPQNQGYVVYAWRFERDSDHRDEFAFSDIIAATNWMVEAETKD